MRFLDKLERKYGKLAIHNLMQYIVIANAVVFVMDIMTNYVLVDLLTFNRSAILSGEVWRIFTFVLIPPMRGMSIQSGIFIIFALYLYYMIGNTLERVWSPFKFNVFYFTGVLIMLISGFVFGTDANVHYLNTTLFFAFATYFPNMEFRIYFILPVKVKYLAYVSAGFLAYLALTGGAYTRISILAGVTNYLLFFGKDLVKGKKKQVVTVSRRTQYKKSLQPEKTHRHKCHVCGRTEKDDPNLEFRYCSKCDGHYAYCSDHLFTHEHIKNGDEIKKNEE